MLDLVAPIAHLVGVSWPEQTVFLASLEFDKREVSGVSASRNVVSSEYSLYFKFMFKQIRFSSRP